ncbi:MAG TPA: DUF3341 domain-containing protein [Reyranella sp.]|jgi:hypothetical protein|nr:DUF3341 domain-containing protein [Reyranella sp.]
MREPVSSPDEVFGVLAEFDRAERLLEGARRARAAGYTRLDAYSPFPIEGLAEILEFSDRRVAWFTLIGGVVGAIVGFGMQAYANLAFPLDVGNRPLVATPAFMLITFELTVLFAVLSGIGAMLALNHLPRLHHPLFEIDEFRLASADKFFLVIFSNDAHFSRDRVAELLGSFDPIRVRLVRHTEPPK